MASAQSCNPVSDCVSFGSLRGTVPHPTNCERFYYCVNDGNGKLIPSATSFACPVGQYYRAAPPTTAGCETETRNGFCDDNYCGKYFDSSTLKCPSSCTSTVPSNIADTGNCSKYFVCLAGGSTLTQNCFPEAPYFDGVTCVNDQSKCCDFTTPYCTVAGAQIADPRDCTSFYICGKADEVPSESYRYSCPSGEHYNAATFKCEKGPCSNGQTTTTTTTTPAPSDCTSLQNFRCPADGYYAQ